MVSKLEWDMKGIKEIEKGRIDIWQKLWRIKC